MPPAPHPDASNRAALALRATFPPQETAMPALKPAVAAELQRQFNHELSAAHAYTALAVWCAEKNLKGFAAYFHKQAGEERAHAQKFMSHLLDRGALPELAAIAAPKAKFENMLDVAKTARVMEQKNTEGIHQAYTVAVKEQDLPAQVALQWFITEQVEEEAWCDEMVERVEAAGSPGGLMQLDRHISRMLEQPSLPGDEG
jgi:ferritin